jgi:hypothetical protein
VALAVWGVTLCVVFSLFCLFCSLFCGLSGDFSGLLVFDRAIFVNYYFFASFGGMFGLLTCSDNIKRARCYRILSSER